MSRNEIKQNLFPADTAFIARELELSVDMVRKVLNGFRNNPSVWIIAESVANENVRKLRSVAKLSEQLASEQPVK